MKRIIAFLLAVAALFFISENAFANERTEAAERLLNAMKMDQLLQNAIQEKLQLQLQKKPALKPYKNVMLAFFKKHMSYQSLKNDLIVLYSDTFTKKELNEMTKFYTSPVGQKALHKVPVLKAKAAEISKTRVQSNINELKMMIEKESNRIQRLQKQ